MPNFKELEHQLHEQRRTTAGTQQEGLSPRRIAPKDTRTQKEQVGSYAKRAVRSLAKRNRKKGWGDPEFRYAMAYLESLLDGKGKQPGQQAEWLIKSVQRIFAGACIELEVRDRTLPGQRQPWYRERKAEAIKFRKSRR